MARNLYNRLVSRFRRLWIKLKLWWEDRFGDHAPTAEEYDSLCEMCDELSRERERLQHALQDIASRCAAAEDLRLVSDMDKIFNVLTDVQRTVVDALGDIKEDV